MSGISYRNQIDRRLPARPKPERKQPRQPEVKVESVRFHRDPTPGPTAGGAIRQKYLRLLLLRSAPCQTTMKVRKTAVQCAAWPAVAAGKFRSAPPQIRIPSAPDRCESTRAEFGRRPDSRGC